MTFNRFKSKHAFILAVVVSILLIMRQYTDYVINEYGYDFSWFSVSIKILINYSLWAILFRLLIKLGNHLIFNKWTPLLIVKHIGVSLIVSAAHRMIAIRLYDYAYFFHSGFLRDLFTPGNRVQMSAGFFSSFLEYWVIMVLIIALGYYLQNTEKQKELNVAKLNALQMQLNPHFLFNTLNSITSLIDIDKKKAQKMLAQLGFLMREMLEHDKKHFISLENELNYIKTYLAIEQIRFQDRLILTFDTEDELNDVKVPTLLLQPIVENAIKHGIAKRVECGELNLLIKSAIIDEKEYLEIIIKNDLPHLNGKKLSPGFGIGTKNVAKRLAHLYGKDQFYANTVANDKFIVEIKIPLHRIS